MPLPTIPPPPARETTLGLVLSGGGARGLAHLGVLTALREAGLRPERVAGTSAGALAGLFHCLGHEPAEIVRMAREALLPGAWARALPGGGQLAFAWLLRSGTLRRRLERLVPGGLRLEDLATPLAVCATDAETRAAVVLERGDAIDAVLASLAIPFVAAPVVVAGRRLVDGCLTNNFPLDVIARHGPGVVLGVDVGATRGGVHAGPAPRRLLVRPEVARFAFGSFAPFDAMVAAGRRAGMAALPALQALLAGTSRDQRQSSAA